MRRGGLRAVVLGAGKPFAEPIHSIRAVTAPEWHSMQRLDEETMWRRERDAAGGRVVLGSLGGDAAQKAEAAHASQQALAQVPCSHAPSQWLSTRRRSAAALPSGLCREGEPQAPSAKPGKEGASRW